MRYHVTVQGRGFVVDLTAGADGWLANVDGRERDATLVPAPDDVFQSLLLDGVSWNLSVSPDAGPFDSPRGLIEGLAQGRPRTPDAPAGAWRIDLGSGPIEARILDDRQKALADRVEAAPAPARGRSTIRTEMPGRVHAVAVRAGQRVERGALLAVVEAMKMENEFRAPAVGNITEVHVKEGDLLAPGAPLVTLDEGDAS